MSTKSLSLRDLAAECERLRASGKRIVHCHGVFDLLHVGHIRHFQKARAFGDVLVVTLTPDRYVNKGANRPAFPEELRVEVVTSLDCVDFAAINEWPSAVETIRAIKPDVFVKGNEFKNRKDTIGHVAKEEQAVKEHGGEMAFTEDITFSSSGLINQFLSPFSGHVLEYLTDFAERCGGEDVLAPLKAAENKSVLCIGDTIIDEYRYVEAIGKSGKEPVLATKYQSREKFAGGILACANHAASFCDRVDIVSFIGEDRGDEDFIRERLKPNVDATLLPKPGSPTLTKTRFVEKYLSQKLFEVYDMNDKPLTEAEDAQYCEMLASIVPRYDVVIVADYGHGCLSRNAIQTICDHAKFLAVNTQSNAGNHGFNMISKYPRADYVSLAHREFALETRNQELTPKEMIEHVATRLNCPQIVLTQGKSGCLSWSERDGYVQIPAFATEIVDRVGAGDAVLSTTALAVAAGASAEQVGFLGNVVGAEAVRIMGNERAIERLPLFRHIECLLKVHPGAEQQRRRRNLKVAA